MRVPAAQPRFLRQREVPTPEPGATRPLSRISAAVHSSKPAPMLYVVAGCLAVAALTLILPTTPTYDPWGWILWGREILHFDLTTTGGPWCKPLPILFTTRFSLFGLHTAPYLWVCVARAGGLLACVLAYRLARRIVGPGWYGLLAGVAAALALFSSFKFVRDAALGNSEAMLAGLVLWAFERHLDGRRDHALYLGFACALLRPEVWPFLGAYGLWLWFKEPQLRVRLIVLGALVPALWFLPEWWGSGDPFRAGSRANNPNPGSAAFAQDPFLELLPRFRKVVIAPVKAAVVIAALWAGYMWFRNRREGLTLAITAFGIAWFVLVAGMTQAGFAGNQRYLILSTVVVSVLGGVGAARVLQGVGWLGHRAFGSERAGARTAMVAFLVALVGSTPFIIEKANNTGRVSGGLDHGGGVWGHPEKPLQRNRGA